MPFLQQAPYPEDQLHARTYLTAHVAHRMAQTTTVLSLPLSLATSVITARRSSPNLPLLPTARTLFVASLQRTAGLAALLGLTLGIPTTFSRMHGREEIEWQDRTWRLLGNAGQREVDVWSAVGGVVGGVLDVRRGGAGFVRMVGGAAMGDLAGVGGYLGWRYGVRGGKRRADKAS